MQNDMKEIKKGDIVYHRLSKLLFRCENTKHEKWMNENKYYKLTDFKTIDYSKFIIPRIVTTNTLP